MLTQPPTRNILIVKVGKSMPLEPSEQPHCALMILSEIVLQDIHRQGEESKAKIQATSAEVEKKLNKKWHIATQVLDQIRKMAHASA